jgi:hypothetical protein
VAGHDILKHKHTEREIERQRERKTGEFEEKAAIKEEAHSPAASPFEMQARGEGGCGSSINPKSNCASRKLIASGTSP